MKSTTNIPDTRTITKATEKGFFLNPCPFCGHNDCFYFAYEVGLGRCFSCDKTEELTPTLTPTVEELKQRLNAIKADVKRGVMKFENLDWLQECAEKYIDTRYLLSQLDATEKRYQANWEYSQKERERAQELVLENRKMNLVEQTNE